jgi:hypothetical protein
MTAINTSISYQSQFAPNPFLNDLRTKSGAQSQIEINGGNLKPVSIEYLVQNVGALGELGMNVNLKA